MLISYWSSDVCSADRVQARVQRAAEARVQLLEAAADEEAGQALFQRRVDQREGRGVARLVVGLGLRVRRRAVARRVDVRGAAGEQQAVERVEHVQHLLALRHHRDDDRRAAGRLPDRAAVLVEIGRAYWRDRVCQYV